MTPLLPLSKADAPAASLLKKMTGSFHSRAAAQKAIRALRRAGYPAGSIRILHTPTRAALDREGFYDVFAKYLRHLADPRHVLVGVTHADIETATRIFLDMGGEVAVNRFFHQSGRHPAKPARVEEGAMVPARLWLE